MFQSIGPNAFQYNSFVEALSHGENWTVLTSGSTGKPKEIILDFSKMKLSAQRSNDFFKLTNDSFVLNTLHANTIGGLMLTARAFFGDFSVLHKEPSLRPLEKIDQNFSLASLAPVQLFHSLIHDLQQLKKIKHLLVGGGSISDETISLLQTNEISIWNSYGMTETYSHIALRKMGFQQEEYFNVLDGIQLSELDGRLCIESEGLIDKRLITNDLVRLITPSSFVWLGRSDLIINTGGIKLGIEDLEYKLQNLIPTPFFIWKEVDEALGEKVVLISTDPLQLNKQELSKCLGRYELPKKFYQVSDFVFSTSGKILRQASFLQTKVEYGGIF